MNEEITAAKELKSEKIVATQPNANDFEPQPPHKTRNLLFAAIALTAVAIAALLFWSFSKSGDYQAGRTVPAPSSSNFETAESKEETFTNQTLTIEPQQLENAGVKIEAVGEQINAGETAALATGVVQANAYRETPVISLAGGVVRSVNVAAGENVAQGQTIAVVFSNEFAEAQSRYVTMRMEEETARRNYERTNRLVTINQTGRGEYEAAQRQLKAADAALDEMRKRFNRTEKLVQIGASSREELEQDTTKLRTAEAEQTEARLRFERAGQLLEINPQARAENEEAFNKLHHIESEIAVARQKLLLYGMPAALVDSLDNVSQISSEIAVAAPISGTVTSRAINQGEVVEANKELARITNLSSLWVVAQVYERDLARVRTGSGATVTSDAFPNRVFRGTVAYIDPRLDEATRTAQARIEIENPNNLLKIGMYVRVAFGALGDAEKTVPIVPAEAVQNLGNQTVVFAATNQPNVFELRPVRVGVENDGRFPILEGLNVGDRVATTGSFTLRAEWLKTKQSSDKH